jgi:hypothetical protein
MDGDTYSTPDESVPSLAILSPQDCVYWRYQPLFRYAPPLSPDDVEYLKGFSTLHALSSRHTPPNSAFPNSDYGGMKRRMYFTGGNLSLLFSRMTIAEIQEFFKKSIQNADLQVNDMAYFRPRIQGLREIDYRVWSSRPVYPYTQQGPLAPVSDWVKAQLVQRAATSLHSRR